jgi:hypothetical protein
MYPLVVSSNHNDRQGNGDITAERLRSEFSRYARLIALLVVITTALENLLPQLKLDQILGTGVASNWVDRLLWIDQGCHWLSFVGIGVALLWARGGGAMMVISAFIAGLFEFRPGHGVLEHPLQFPPASTLMLITSGLLFMLSAPTKGDLLGVIGWLQNTQRQLSAFQASSGYRWRHRLISLESFLIATVIIAAAAWLMRTQGVKSLIVVARLPCNFSCRLSGRSIAALRYVQFRLRCVPGYWPSLPPMFSLPFAR